MKQTRSLIFTLLILLILSCTPKSGFAQDNKSIPKTENMDTTNNQEGKINELKNSMMNYMKEARPSYTERDVLECIGILNEYIADMEKAHSKEEGMQVVKKTVLQLNDLNEKCNSTLIETGEREAITAIIITTGNQKGYNAPDDDITEEWRQW